MLIGSAMCSLRRISDRRVTDLDLHRLARTEVGGDGGFGAVVRLFRLRLLFRFRRSDRSQIDGRRVDVPAAMILAAVTGAAQAQRQLVERHVQSTELIGAGSLGAHHGAACDHGDLHTLRGVGLTRIPLMRQHDLSSLRIRRDSGHTIHLAFDDITELLLDLRMTSGNDDFHVDLPILKRCHPLYVCRMASSPPG